MSHWRHPTAHLLRWLFPLVARAPYSLIAALMLVRFADEWFTFFPAGAIEPIKQDTGLSYAQAGIVLVALSAGGLLGHAFGIAADYLDRRLLAAFGAAMYGVCMTAFALADSFFVLTAASFFWGAATDAFVHGCEVALVDLYRDELAPALAHVNAFGAVGDLLGPLTLAAVFALGVGWRAVFLGGAALMLLYALWLLTLHFPPPSPPEEEGHTPLRGILLTLRDSRIVVLGLVHGLFSVLDEPFWGFTVAYLERVRGLSGSLATLIVGVGVGGGLAGFLAVGHVTRRLAVRPALLCFGVLVGLSVVGVIAAPVTLLRAAAAFSFGFAGAVFYSVLQATYLSLRQGQAGTTGAVISTIGLLGLGYPPLVGRVSDLYGLTAGLSLYAAAPVAMLLLLILFPSAARTAAELPAAEA